MKILKSRRNLMAAIAMILAALFAAPAPALAYELASNMKTLQVIKPQAATATVTSAAVDLTGFDEAVIILDVGTTTGTSPTLDVKVQSSATTGGTYADVTGAVFTQVTTGTAIAVGRLRVDSAKPFIKIVATIGGTTPSVPLAVSIHAEGGTKARPYQTPQWTTF